jgi:hypothetical protein
MPSTHERYYRKLLKGSKATPRGLGVSFVHNISYMFTPGQVVRRMRDNPAIGLMELTQLIAGTFDVDAIARVAPNAKLELFTGQSAYGPRVGHQLDAAVNELLSDHDSRRAVIMIAGLNETPETLPCTLSMQFQVQQPERFLLTTVTMRSSDAIWGLPYDMIQFGGVAMVVANCVGASIGPFSCAINIANGHVYDSTKIDHPIFDDGWRFDAPNLGSIQDYRQWAKAVLAESPTRSTIEEVYDLRKSDAR